MDEIWLSLEEACHLKGCKPWWVRALARRGELKKRLAENRRKNGKREMEYALSSFSADEQLGWAALNSKIETRNSKLASNLIEAGRVTRPLPSPAANGGGSPVTRLADPGQDTRSAPTPQTLPLFSESPRVAPEERAVLPEDLRRQADERLAIISPLLEFRDRASGSTPVIKTSDGREVRSLNELAEWLAKQHGITARTIWRWHSVYKESGYAALADQPRRDKGLSRFFSTHMEAAAFVRAKYLVEKLDNYALIYDALKYEWPSLRKNGDGPPSYSTLAAYLDKLPKPLVTYSHDGPREYFSRHAPHIQRGPVGVMDWWVLDHRQFDVFVRNALFSFRGAEELYSLWLTKIVDWGSRKVVGYAFAPEPSSRTINSALRMAVVEFGFPRNLYWDNGRDFQRAERNLEEIVLEREAEGLLQANSVSITTALPYRPRSKPIESWFNHWSQRFDLLFRPAWRGRKPGECPEDCREAQKAHAAYLKGKRPDTPIRTDAELILCALQFIREVNDRIHPKLDGKTPNEVFDEHHPPSRRRPPDARSLAAFFWQREKRTVLPGGCIELLNARYEPAIESALALDVLQGRQITVAYDPYNLGEAIALDDDGRFIGELRAQKFLEQSAHGRVSEDEIRAAERRWRALQKTYRGYINVLAVVAQRMGWKTERDALLDRALNAGTDRALLTAAPAGRAPRQIGSHQEHVEVSSPFVSDAVRSTNFWED
jgi:transposase InsO family protein